MPLKGLLVYLQFVLLPSPQAAVALDSDGDTGLWSQLCFVAPSSTFQLLLPFTQLPNPETWTPFLTWPSLFLGSNDTHREPNHFLPWPHLCLGHFPPLGLLPLGWNPTILGPVSICSPLQLRVSWLPSLSSILMPHQAAQGAQTCHTLSTGLQPCCSFGLECPLFLLLANLYESIRPVWGHGPASRHALTQKHTSSTASRSDRGKLSPRSAWASSPHSTHHLILQLQRSTAFVFVLCGALPS